MARPFAKVRNFPTQHVPPPAIAHTRTRRDYYDQKGAFPPSYYGVQYTLSNPSYQSLIHMVRETDTFRSQSQAAWTI